MTKSYSLDHRERIAGFVDGGRSRHAAAGHYGVSVSFVVKLTAARRATGSLKPKPGGGWPYSKLKAHLRARAIRSIDGLWQAIGDICDLYTPDECRNHFNAAGYGHT